MKAVSWLGLVLRFLAHIRREWRRRRTGLSIPPSLLRGRHHIDTAYGMMTPEATIMRRTAKVFMIDRSQAVRLPKEFQFSTNEVFIRKSGDDVILSPRPRDWSS